VLIYACNSCNGSSVRKSRVGSSNAAQEAGTSADPDKAFTAGNSADTDNPLNPMSREPDQGNDESISQPANISGSYLICAEAKQATADSADSILNCGLRDQSSSAKVNIDTYPTKLWTYQVENASPVLAYVTELTTSTQWHVSITLKGSSQDEVKRAQKSIKIFLTLVDVAGNKFQEVSELTLNCNRLAGGNWITVPGDPIYGTAEFCIQKYAAANVSNSPSSQAGIDPWVNTSVTVARSACAGLGNGYRLITNPEWMTVAANLANVGSNWSGGSVGAGTLRHGHGDNNPGQACAANANDANAYVENDCSGSAVGTFGERRTSILSNGAVVWDIGGNIWNWVDYVNATDKPTPTQSLYYEYPSITGTATTPKSHLVPLNSTQPWWTDSWNSQQGIGRFYPGTNGTGGIMLRGLFWNGGANTGAFAGGLFNDGTALNAANGFRCTWQPPT
jgi:hypothetical protein